MVMGAGHFDNIVVSADSLGGSTGVTWGQASGHGGCVKRGGAGVVEEAWATKEIDQLDHVAAVAGAMGGVRSLVGIHEGNPKVARGSSHPRGPAQVPLGPPSPRSLAMICYGCVSCVSNVISSPSGAAFAGAFDCDGGCNVCNSISTESRRSVGTVDVDISRGLANVASIDRVADIIADKVTGGVADRVVDRVVELVAERVAAIVVVKVVELVGDDPNTPLVLGPMNYSPATRTSAGSPIVGVGGGVGSPTYGLDVYEVVCNSCRVRNDNNINLNSCNYNNDAAYN